MEVMNCNTENEIKVDSESFENIIEKISLVNDFSEEFLINAYTLLLKLFNNIINNPKDEKFRIIKPSNKIIKTQLFFDDRTGALFENLIMSAGFIRTEQGFLFSSDRNVNELQNHVNILDAILHSYKHSDKSKQNIDSSGGIKNSEFPLNNSSLEGSAKKKDNLQTFRRKDENDIIQRANAELNAVREKQREKYKEKKNGSSSSTSYQNFSGNNGQGGGGGFFDFLWGGTGGGGPGGGGPGGRGRGRGSESNRRRFMTLRDVAPPNKQS